MDINSLPLPPFFSEIYGDAPETWQVEALPAHASPRRYYRVHVPGRHPDRFLLMQMPEDTFASDEVSQATVRPPQELPFLSVQRWMRECGLPLPEVYAARLPFVALEDLGSESFEDRYKSADAAEGARLYAKAVDLLVSMHTRCASPPAGHIVAQRKFEAELLRSELDHFREWGVEAQRGSLPSAERRALDACFERLVQELLAVPRGFVHRDFQSRNLMWHRAERDALYIIDFQDALMGPRPYDLVALLCDSYVDLDLPLQEAMIARYVASSALSPDEAAAFPRWFWLQALQRKLKDTGRFVFLDRVRGNPDFLPYLPQSLVYVRRALQQLDDYREVARYVES